MKILIIKLGAIGDVIMSLSMLTEIERLYPGAQITWVCGRTVTPLLSTFSQINEIITIDENKLLAGSKLGKLAVVAGLWRKLSGRSYDLVVLGHGDPAYRLLIKSVKTEVLRVFTRDATSRQWPIPSRHHCDEYARMITNQDDHMMVRGEFPDVIHLLSNRRDPSANPLVALSPGGASTARTALQLRRWPIEHYVGLAESLIKLGYGVVLTGGPEDQWCYDSFSHLEVMNIIGKKSIVEQISFYSTCSLLVTHDSGPMHMASLAGIPVIAMFGPTNARQFEPRSPGSIALWGGENLPCRPCYDGRTYSACTRNVCLESVTAQQVVDQVVQRVPVVRSKDVAMKE
jgi:heptosyltransferase-2